MTSEHPAIEIRPARPVDTSVLATLLAAIPPGEHVFLKRAIDSPQAARRWLDDTPATWSIAHIDGQAVGAVGVVFREGWSAHVAELRLVIAPEHRGHGVGTALAQAGVTSAVELGAVVVDVEALVEQQGVIALFGRLGFIPEALLTDHVRDSAGALHDLVVLSLSTSTVASSLMTVGAEETTQ